MNVKVSDNCRSRFLSEIFNLQAKSRANILATSRFIPEIIERFEGSMLEAKDDYGWTPLSYAASRGYEAVVKLLLEKIAELGAKDYNGRTPLLLAAEKGHEAVVKLLL